MTRIEAALELADRCWRRALYKEPRFVAQYFESAEDLLAYRPVVMGDEFREHCRRRQIILPSGLHHNTWVSGVRALNLIGWIEPVTKVTPIQRHNHMDSVTLWKSTIMSDRIPAQLTLFANEQ